MMPFGIVFRPARSHLPVIMALALVAACAPPDQEPVTHIAVIDSHTLVVSPESEMLAHIRVDNVALRPVPQVTITVPARLMPDPTRISRVTLPVPGRVGDIPVRIGQRVEAGQPVLVINSAEAEAAIASLRQARAELRQSASVLQKAQLALERKKELKTVGAVSLREVIEGETELAQAEAGHEQASAAVSQAERALRVIGLTGEESGQKLILTAQTTGRVIDIATSVGAFLDNHADPVITIADLGLLWVMADMPEKHIRHISVGDEMILSLTAFPEEDFVAEVVRIADVLDPDTRTLKIFMELDNPDGRLRPDMFGRGRYMGGMRMMPVVPVDAVVHRGSQALVLVEEAEGVFAVRNIRVGSRNGQYIPVLEGLTGTERVVVDGCILLLGAAGLL